MKIYVTSPGFNHLSLSGSGNIVGQNKISDSSRIYVGLSGSGDVRLEVDAPSVEANITGSGNITLSGNTRTFSADTRGSGDIKAFDLKAEESAVDIAGSGNAEVFASVKLKVDVAGSGDVKYKGAPQVDSHVAGSGGVKKVD
jgi:Putative auto-transporter adhesin, head GIN domain